MKSVGEAEQATRILLSFFIALAIVYLIGTYVGEERKRLWFKKRQNSNFFTRRGMLGDTWNFGVPYTWQGFVIALLIFVLIGAVSYSMIFSV